MKFTLNRFCHNYYDFMILNRTQINYMEFDIAYINLNEINLQKAGK